MNTKQSIVLALVLGALLAGTRPAQAALSFSTSDGGATYTGGASSLAQLIPDNTQSGVGYSINFADLGRTVYNISISLNLSGGYNGDLYAYLSHGSQTTKLFDQITGSPSSAGMNVTLVPGTANPIQTVTGFGSGTTLSGTTFTANQDLSAFTSTDPNGNWTFFIADMKAGDSSTLNSFSVNITAVPEPVTGALILAVLVGLVRYAWRKLFSAKKQVPAL
jgi:subtilisin-like proprotein convertase family protein